MVRCVCPNRKARHGERCGLVQRRTRIGRRCVYFTPLPLPLCSRSSLVSCVEWSERVSTQFSCCFPCRVYHRMRVDAGNSGGWRGGRVSVWQLHARASRAYFFTHLRRSRAHARRCQDTRLRGDTGTAGTLHIALSRHENVCTARGAYTTKKNKKKQKYVYPNGVHREHTKHDTTRRVM